MFWVPTIPGAVTNYVLSLVVMWKAQGRDTHKYLGLPWRTWACIQEVRTWQMGSMQWDWRERLVKVVQIWTSLRRSILDKWRCLKRHRLSDQRQSPCLEGPEAEQIGHEEECDHIEMRCQAELTQLGRQLSWMAHSRLSHPLKSKYLIFFFLLLSNLEPPPKNLWLYEMPAAERQSPMHGVCTWVMLVSGGVSKSRKVGCCLEISVLEEGGVQQLLGLRKSDHLWMERERAFICFLHLWSTCGPSSITACPSALPVHSSSLWELPHETCFSLSSPFFTLWCQLPVWLASPMQSHLSPVCLWVTFIISQHSEQRHFPLLDGHINLGFWESSNLLGLLK